MVSFFTVEPQSALRRGQGAKKWGGVDFPGEQENTYWEDNNRHYPRVLADIGKYFTFVNIEKSGFLDTPSALHPGSLRLVWTSISG